jgi:hypothetical protein
MKTKKVPVPANGSALAAPLVEHYLTVAAELWNEKYGNIAVKNGWDYVIKLVGLKTRKCSSFLGTTGETTVIVATAEMGGLKSTFSFKLDGSYFEYDNEEEI